MFRQNNVVTVFLLVDNCIPADRQSPVSKRQLRKPLHVFLAEHLGDRALPFLGDFMPVQLTCDHCGKMFSVTPSRAKNYKTHFCSMVCMQAAHVGESNPNWKGGLVYGKCLMCGNETKVKRSHAQKGAGKFCSHKCASEWTSKNALGYDPDVRVKKQCVVCGKDVFIKPSHADHAGTYCSRDCMSIDYKSRMCGEDNPNYSRAGRHICPTCGVEFVSYQKGARYCSTLCRGIDFRGRVRSVWSREKASITMKRVIAGKKAIRSWKDRPIDTSRYAQKAFRFPESKKKKFQCVVCGKEGLSYRERKTCSKACADIVQTNRVATLCVVCGNEFFVPPSAMMYSPRKTCSSECARVYRSIRQQGEKSHRWQGGRTSAVLLDRQSLPYQMWREAVFARDNFTCQLCHMRGGKLSAHHIKPYATHPEFRRAVGNGITLCWQCHTSIKNKEAQYEEQFFAVTGGIESEAQP